jgi:hypothetical protein
VSVQATALIGRRGRPGVVNLAAAAVLLVMIASAALIGSHSQPPAIAEFAPQAQKPIQQAPGELSSVFGKGGNGKDVAATPTPSPTPAAAAAAGPTPSPTPLPNGADVKPCVGNPPRQTQDPQSPPCISFWTGDNGGGTSKGVSATEIDVVVPDDPNGGKQPSPSYIKGLQNFFNKHFQFYNRKLNLVPDYNNTSVPSQQTGFADTVDDNHHPFASTEYGGDGIDYYQELAHRGIVSAGVRPVMTQAMLAANAPYTWQYDMSVDQQFANVGSWICSRIAGQTAVHATGNDGSTPPKPLNQQQRKFGLIADAPQTDYQLDLTPLYQQLQACNALPAPADRKVSNDKGAYDSNPSLATNNMAQLKSDGVTTVLCLCYFQTGLDLDMAAAQGQNYFPEWIASTYYFDDFDWTLTTAPSSERGQLMGISFQPPAHSLANDPAWQAASSGDPNLLTNPQAQTTQAIYNLDIEYRSLLLLASGIQMAGPHLTPQTFQAGLQRTLFPNPDTALNQGHVGFVGGSYSMTLDATEWWYSNSVRGPYPDESSGGAMCFTAAGRRYSGNSYPRGGDPVQQPCINAT